MVVVVVKELIEQKKIVYENYRVQYIAKRPEDSHRDYLSLSDDLSTAIKEFESFKSTLNSEVADKYMIMKRVIREITEDIPIETVG